MKGDCYIIGRAINRTADYSYYPYHDKKDNSQDVVVDEDYRIELDPEFCSSEDEDFQSWS